MTPKRIAIIGGGITGLAAAHRLLELDPTCRISLFDPRDRLGGVLSTIHEDGLQIEESADNFITTVPWGLDLCKRLGLEDQLVQTNAAFRRTFVVRRGKLRTLPDGFMMMAPTRMWPMAVTPILSPLGKLRAGLEFFLPPKADDEDESMAGFVRRRLGREVFDRLVEPLVSGVYAADMDKLSLLATLPRFREMEKKHGSLIRAMRKQMKSSRDAAKQSGARYSMFVTLEQGLSSLVDALAAKLPEGTVRLNTAVTGLAQHEDAWQVTLDNESTETFDSVIMTAPSHVAAKLLAPIHADAAERMGRIQHEGTAIVTVALNRDQVGHPMNGMGAVVPGIENSPILAASFSSQKYVHRAPADKTLIRVFAGGARSPELAEMEDEKLVPLVWDELAKLLKIEGKPLKHWVAHWPRTMPQYHVGHLQLVDQIEADIRSVPNLELAGNAYHGVGVPNCIHGGEQAAERVLGREE